MIVGSCRSALLLAGLTLFCGVANPAEPGATAPAVVTKAAAERCNLKLKALQDYAVHPKAGRVQTTQFSEDEVNSYFALVVSSQFNPCLKSLTFRFEEDRLQGDAIIDFDRLETSSGKLFPKVLSLLLSGVHTITARGQLVSGNGKASFRLEQARFDNSTLPKALVEEIISAVGKKQNPPFDPLQPSQLFYGIQKIDVHSGYVIAYQ
jgi:hypothetical protein